MPYMAPEVWHSKVSAHSDQYSLAASYVELRLGRLLFPHSNTYDLMIAHTQSMPDLESIPADVLKRAKLLVLCYPNSPTGKVATRDFYARVVDFAKRILLRGEQAEGKIAIKCVRACIGHMSAETGLLIKRIFRQIRLPAEQFVTKLDQTAILLSPPGGHPFGNGNPAQYFFGSSARLSPSRDPFR